MKKSMLYTGMAYCTAGLCCLAAAVFTETWFDGMFWGMFGALTAPGLLMMWKYFHWSRPEHQEEYARRLEIEQIEMQDERKVMLRDKSGRIVYQIMTGVYCVLIMAFSICSMGGWFMPFSLYAVIGLTVLQVFQWVCGMAAFGWESKRR